MHAYSSLIHNSQKLKISQMFIKLYLHYVLYSHHEIVLSNKKIEHVVTWMAIKNMPSVIGQMQNRIHTV